MEQDDVIRRLKGLGKGSAPAAPDFTGSTQPIPQVVPIASRSSRWGVAPIAAAVAVLALATAALALPKGGPLRQVLASDDTTETTDEVDDATAAENTPVVPDPCETMPVEAGSGGDAEVTTEEDLAAREQRAQAWAEWRAQNCSDPATAGQEDDGSDLADDDDESDDDSDKESRDKDGKEGREHSARDEACTGPPPHANNPGNGDPNRTDAERETEKREWQEWHRQNCTNASGDKTDDDDKGRPEDKPKSGGSGHDKAKGEGHGPNDANHQDRGDESEDEADDDED